MFKIFFYQESYCNVFNCCNQIFFFLNNYKTQTILLINQGLKLFWFLTNQVQRTRFWGYKIECIVLGFPSVPKAELDKVPT